MKKLFAILVLLIASVSYGQSTSEFSTAKMAFGINFSPDYSYRLLIAKPTYGWMKEIRDSTELPRLGFTTGLSVFYKFSERITFESGLQFADEGEKSINYTNFEGGISIDPAIPEDGLRFVYHYYYLKFPLKINYYFVNGKIRWFVGGGVSLNFFLFDRTTVIISGVKDNSSSIGLSSNSRFCLGLIASTGVDYSISKRLNLRLEPVFRGSLTLNNTFVLRKFQYSLGAGLGLFYKLQ